MLSDKLFNTDFIGILSIKVISFWLILIFLNIWIDFFLCFCSMFITITFRLVGSLIFLNILKHLFLSLWLLIHNYFQFFISNLIRIHRFNRFFFRISFDNIWNFILILFIVLYFFFGIFNRFWWVSGYQSILTLFHSITLWVLSYNHFCIILCIWLFIFVYFIVRNVLIYVIILPYNLLFNFLKYLFLYLIWFIYLKFLHMFFLYCFYALAFFLILWCLNGNIDIFSIWWLY